MRATAASQPELEMRVRALESRSTRYEEDIASLIDTVSVIHEDTQELKVSTQELKVSTQELKVSTEDLKVSTEDLKVSTEDLKVSTQELKVSTQDLKVRLSRVEKGIGALLAHQGIVVDSDQDDFVEDE